MALTDDFSSEQFALKWNNFSNNLSGGFSELLYNRDLVDVTLAVEGRLLQAHKLILSVCSPYFHEIFKANPCQHPVVILKDIKYQDIEALINFMYQGEVNVRQEELGNFLKVAEVLQIKGLTLNNDQGDLEEPINGHQESEVKSVKPKERSRKRGQDTTQSSKKVKRSQEVLPNQETNSDKDQDQNNVENSVDHSNETNNGHSADVIKEGEDLNEDITTDDTNDNSVESNIGPVTYRLSARGRPQLVYEGFVYNLTSRSEVLNRSHYRCAEQHRGCRGKCAVISERFMPTGVKDHNHLPGYLSEEDYRKKKPYED